MVWRGRIPTSEDLTPVQQGNFADRWDRRLSAEQRQEMLAYAGLPISHVETPLRQLSPAEREEIWREHVWDVLRDRIGYHAAERVMPAEKDHALDRGDHGVLSNVVRQSVSGGIPSPLPVLARWLPWLWQGSDRFPPRYLTGLALVALVLGLLGIFLVVLNREMAARAVIEATTRLRRAVYHHTFRLGTLAIRAMGPS